MAISQVANEFGGSVPHMLSEYYRGGAYVPNIGANAGIPTSGAMNLSSFYGATAYIAPSVSISPSSFSTSVVLTSGASDTATAVPANGTPSFSYAWTVVSTSGCSASIGSPSSQVTSLSVSGVAVNTTGTATFRVTITDGAGSTAYADVTFSHQNLSNA